MAGLMRKKQDPGASAGPQSEDTGAGAPLQQQAPTAGGGTQDEEPSNVSPEEQAQYDEFVTKGLELIYSEQAMGQLVQSMKGDGNPVEGLANALVTVVTRLEDSAEDSGKQFSGDVKYHGAIDIMEHMVELAEQAGLPEYSDEDTESALYLALDQYRAKRQQEGKLPMEEINQDMESVMQAEQQGTLDQILPGVEQYAQNAPAPPVPGDGPGQMRKG